MAYTFDIPEPYKSSKTLFVYDSEAFSYQGDTYYFVEYLGNVLLHSKNLNKTLDIQFAGALNTGVFSRYTGGKTYRSLLVNKNESYDFYKCVIPHTFIIKGDRIIVPYVYKFTEHHVMQISRDNAIGFKVFDLKLNELKFIKNQYYTNFMELCNYVIILGKYYVVDKCVYDRDFNLIRTLDGELDRSQPIVGGKLNMMGSDGHFLYDLNTFEATTSAGRIRGDHSVITEGGRITFGTI
jgi:hypothetical protein